jgi:DNA polymerase
MGALYGVDLPDDTVLGIVKAWRAAHPNTVKLWYGLENACRDAVHSPGVVKRVGKLAIQRDGVWLRIRLPSGRYLCYPGVECDDAGKLSYLGVNQYTRKWERLRTYGGKLVENVTQAASRDVLCYGMKLAEESGYPVVLHVHDELLCEVPDSPDYNVARLSAIMSTNPPWAEGLPLAAAGFETYRYRKED